MKCIVARRPRSRQRASARARAKVLKVNAVRVCLRARARANSERAHESPIPLAASWARAQAAPLAAAARNSALRCAVQCGAARARRLGWLGVRVVVVEWHRKRWRQRRTQQTFPKFKVVAAAAAVADVVFFRLCEPQQKQQQKQRRRRHFTALHCTYFAPPCACGTLFVAALVGPTLSLPIFRRALLKADSSSSLESYYSAARPIDAQENPN